MNRKQIGLVPHSPSLSLYPFACRLKFVQYLLLHLLPKEKSLGGFVKERGKLKDNTREEREREIKDTHTHEGGGGGWKMQFINVEISQMGLDDAAIIPLGSQLSLCVLSFIILIAPKCDGREAQHGWQDFNWNRPLFGM
jgi:hypothetical protein